MHMHQERNGVSELFFTHLLSRHIRFERDLFHQLSNFSEKRLEAYSPKDSLRSRSECVSPRCPPCYGTKPPSMSNPR